MNEMRQITAQIQREMESTRTELHRGLVELPREAQASAGEMRRVVGEQIKVLNELSAIATRSSSNFDAEPAISAAVQPPRETRPVQSAPASLPRATAPVTTARSTPAEAQPLRRPATPAYAPAPPRERRPEAEAKPEAGRAGGWLTDLLSRASREEEPLPSPGYRAPPATPANASQTSGAGQGLPAQATGSQASGGPKPAAPRPAPGHGPSANPAAPQPVPTLSPSGQTTLASLDTIAVDIARMIDHDVAAQMWDRYQRGEHSVFNRAMYTPQGQQMFDEIRRKYRRDSEFRQTADRYIEEFERLLSEVARDPASQRGYLTSDTGKVYTILAHAAGRLS
jgi:hypothetical protein